MKNSRAVIRLICSVICFLMLSGILVASLGVKNLDGVTNHMGKNYSVDSRDIDSITIDLITDDLIIYTTNTEQIDVIDKGEKKQPLEVEVVGRHLSIKRKKEIFRWFNFMRGEEQVGVYLPSKLFDSIALNTISGDMDIKDIAADYIGIDTVSGEIEGKDIACDSGALHTTSGDIEVGIQSEKLEISTTSGDVKLDLKGKRLDIKSVSGEVKVNTKAFIEEISIDTVSGDVEVRQDHAYGFLVELDTVSGKLEASVGDIGEEKRGKWRGYYKDGKSVMEVKTTSGNVEIK